MTEARKDPSFLHVPPQNLQAEEAIISAVLIDNSTLLDVVELIGPEDFYKTAHQKIFSAITDLFNRNEPVDLVTVTNRLKTRGHLDEIGGAAYLAQMMDAAPMAVNAQHYARIVHDKACLRRLIESAASVTKRCFEEQDDVDEIIDFAETSIYRIGEKKIKPSFFPISQIILQNVTSLEERYSNKAMVTGVPTGFTKIDQLTAGLQRADLIILAARPSMGKTALALNIARNAAIDYKIPTAVFSLEMSRDQLGLRLLCAEARVDSASLRSGFFKPDDWKKLTDAADTLCAAPLFIDDSPDVTSMTIRAKSRRLQMSHGLGLVIVDYLQLMRPRTPLDRRDLEISEISRAMKNLAKELDLPVVALSQLNRELEKRTDKRPQLADLRESGALEQDADVVAFIYRDEVYNKDPGNPNRGKAEVIVAKQRNGPTGIVHLAFLNAYTRFESLANEATAM
jgi:replicative DNA helicase